MRTPTELLSDEHLVDQFANFHYKWLRQDSFDYFDYVEELRREILKRIEFTEPEV